MSYNDNVTEKFADLIQSMLVKKSSDRPEAIWEFLKAFRDIEVFKTKPEPPDTGVFDT